MFTLLIVVKIIFRK